MTINFEDANIESVEDILQIDVNQQEIPSMEEEKLSIFGDAVMDGELPSVFPTVNVFCENQHIYSEEEVLPLLFTHGIILGDVAINYKQIIETRIIEHVCDDASSRQYHRKKGATIGAVLGGGGGLIGSAICAAIGAGVGAITSLKNKLIRENNKSMAKIKKEPIDLSLCEPFVSSLPFRLTEDQKNAANEIINDMNQSSLMYRLLQGDVGTGKTAVAFVAMYANFLRGDQSALMAPTDALAKQHYENAIKMFSGTKVRIALLVGSTPASEKRKIK